MIVNVKVDEGTSFPIEVGEGTQSVRWLANVACAIQAAAKSTTMTPFYRALFSSNALSNPEAHPGSYAPSYVLTDDKLLNPEGTVRQALVPDQAVSVILQGDVRAFR
jgi:hypothetical protein